MLLKLNSVLSSPSALKIGLISFSCFTLLACGSSSSNSNAEPQLSLFGSVSGYVMDSKGASISNVAVYFEDAYTTTSSSGYYQLSDIQLPDDANQEITLKLVPESSGFVGTSLVITAAAIGADTTSRAGFPQQFNVTANAELPSKGATFSGTLRAIYDGQPLRDQPVSLRLNSIDLSLENQNGITQFFDPLNTIDDSVRTEENGRFTVNNLIEQARYDLNVAGYTIISIADFSSTYESPLQCDPQWQTATLLSGITSELGEILLSLETGDDTFPPFVDGVDAVIELHNSEARVPLDSPTSPAGVIVANDLTTLSITFSERITAKLDQSSIKIWLPGEDRFVENLVTALSEDRRSITISWPHPLTTDNQLAMEIRFKANAFSDCAGNRVRNASSYPDGLIMDLALGGDISFDRFSEEYFSLDIVLQAAVAE